MCNDWGALKCFFWQPEYVPLRRSAAVAAIAATAAETMTAESGPAIAELMQRVAALETDNQGLKVWLATSEQPEMRIVGNELGT